MVASSEESLLLRCPWPVGIGFGLEALGTCTKTRLARRDVVVHLPRPLRDTPVLIQPRVLDDLVEEPEYAYGEDLDNGEHFSPWGWPISWGSPDHSIFAVAQVVLAFQPVSTKDAETVVTEFIGAFRPWFRLVKDWVEVLTEQDLDDVAPRRRVEVAGHRWAAWAGGAHVRVAQRVVVDFDFGEPVHVERWARVLELVGTGTQPAVEHLLLRDARASHARAQYRRAVVDAATSLEIALHRLLLAEHRRVPTNLADELVRLAERWTLGPLYGTLDRLGLLPTSVTRDLVTLRNSVIHKKAHEPTERESAAMLQAAADSVNAATPIDTTL